MIYHIDWNDTQSARLLVLSLLAMSEDYDTILSSIISNGFVQKEASGFSLTEKGMNYLNASTWFDDTGEIVKEMKTRSDERQIKRRCENLAKQLMSLWPTGTRKDIGQRGVNASWRGNSQQVAARLYMMPPILDYTDEQILKAARVYTRSFKQDNTYMRGLLNFILKREETSFDDGPDSTLLEYLEQMDDIMKERQNQNKKERLL